MKFPDDILEYEYDFGELNHAVQGAHHLSLMNFTNPEIIKAIAQLYEKAFWGNELTYDTYKQFCFSFMSEKDENVVQLIIEANYENFINESNILYFRMNVYNIAILYRQLGNLHLFKLWKRIADTVKCRYNRR